MELSERQLGCLRGIDRHGGRASAAQVYSYLWEKELVDRETGLYARNPARGVATTLTRLSKKGLVTTEPGWKKAYLLTDKGQQVVMDSYHPATTPKE